LIQLTPDLSLPGLSVQSPSSSSDDDSYSSSSEGELPSLQGLMTPSFQGLVAPPVGLYLGQNAGLGVIGILPPPPSHNWHYQNFPSPQQNAQISEDKIEIYQRKGDIAPTFTSERSREERLRLGSLVGHRPPLTSLEPVKRKYVNDSIASGYFSMPPFQPNDVKVNKFVQGLPTIFHQPSINKDDLTKYPKIIPVPTEEIPSLPEDVLHQIFTETNEQTGYTIHPLLVNSGLRQQPLCWMGISKNEIIKWMQSLVDDGGHFSIKGRILFIYESYDEDGPIGINRYISLDIKEKRRILRVEFDSKDYGTTRNYDSGFYDFSPNSLPDLLLADVNYRKILCIIPDMNIMRGILAKRESCGDEKYIDQYCKRVVHSASYFLNYDKLMYKFLELFYDNLHSTIDWQDINWKDIDIKRMKEIYDALLSSY
jgi:hypothetical protein